MRHRRNAWWIAAWLAILLVMGGCAEITPFAPPNHREEGLQKGVFTGPQGQWVILGPAIPQTGAEVNKTGTLEAETNRRGEERPQKPPDGEQP